MKRTPGFVVANPGGFRAEKSWIVDLELATTPYSIPTHQSKSLNGGEGVKMIWHPPYLPDITAIDFFFFRADWSLTVLEEIQDELGWGSYETSPKSSSLLQFGVHSTKFRHAVIHCTGDFGR
jgi:hypothetical protein